MLGLVYILERQSMHAIPFNRVIRVYKLFTSNKPTGFYYMFEKNDPGGSPGLVETTLADIAQQASMKQSTFCKHIKTMFAAYPWDTPEVLDITDMVRYHHNVYQNSLREKLTPLQRREKRINAARAKRGFDARAQPRLRTKNLDIIAELRERRKRGDL